MTTSPRMAPLKGPASQLGKLVPGWPRVAEIGEHHELADKEVATPSVLFYLSYIQGAPIAA